MSAARRTVIRFALIFVAVSITATSTIRLHQLRVLAQWERDPLMPPSVCSVGPLIDDTTETYFWFLTPAFATALKAYGLKNGDHPDRFIDVFGTPDSILAWDYNKKLYRWKNDYYIWPVYRDACRLEVSNFVFPTANYLHPSTDDYNR